MANKRFVLTVDEVGLVQLWQLDTLECAMTFPNEPFNRVKERLNQFDMRHSPQTPLPQSWMTCDIRLGSLTLNLEDRSWNKGMVDDNRSNVVALMTNPRGLEQIQAQEPVQEEQKELQDRGI